MCIISVAEMNSNQSTVSAEGIVPEYEIESLTEMIGIVGQLLWNSWKDQDRTKE